MTPLQIKGSDTKKVIVVTKFSQLPEYLAEKGIDFDEVIPRIDHPAQIRDCIVIGVIPLHLAAEAYRVIEIPLRMTDELRGRDLTLDEIRSIARNPRKFMVFED